MFRQKVSEIKQRKILKVSEVTRESPIETAGLGHLSHSTAVLLFGWDVLSSFTFSVLLYPRH